MSARVLSVALAIGICFTGGSARAQEAATVNIGPLVVTPKIRTQFAFFENVTNARKGSESLQIDSWRLLVNPTFVATTRTSTSIFNLVGGLENGNYFSSTDDNFTDYFLHYDSKHYIAEKQSLQLTLDYRADHDDRGDVYTIGRPYILNAPDTYQISDAAILHTIGSGSSKLRIETEVAYESVDYDIDDAPLFNRDRQIPSLDIYGKYRIGVVTSLVLKLRVDQVDYESISIGNSLDSLRTSARVGLAWDANEFFEGRATIGYEKRDFDADDRIDYSGIDWLIDLRWSPLTQTRVLLTTESNSQETNGNGDYMDEQVFELALEHDWLERLSTRVGASYNERDFIGATEESILREETSTEFQFNLSYQFRRWMKINSFYQLSNRESKISNIRFDRQIYGLGVEVTL